VSASIDVTYDAHGMPARPARQTARAWAFAFGLAFAGTALAMPTPASAQGDPRPQRTTGPVTEVPIHDPVLIRQGGSYYLFGTGRGIAVWASDDRENWRRLDPVFTAAPAWVAELLPEFRNDIWAPDIFEHNGTYYLYYSVSAFGRNNSAIGVATNSTVDPSDPTFKWVDHGIVVQSVPGRDMWNAIDAHLVLDDDGTPWMSFGSHWGGLKLVKMDTSLTRIAEPQEWRTIAARHRYWKLDDRDAGDSANPELDYESLYPTRILEMNRASQSGAIEAPVIFRKNGWYYLFASWDRCCRGANSTYKLVVGRSRDIQGPYVDREGENLLHGGGSLVVHGFAESDRWAAGGHNDVVTVDGADYLVFHAYDKADEGRSKLLLREILWDEYGWPSVQLNRDRR
jgi:arabinan endo-1,5-alpha-L-arabinosidase